MKEALGLWEHPFDRPFFGLVACSAITIWHVFWKPISDCERWEILETPLVRAALSTAVAGFCLFLVLGFFWTLPDHVFGTSRHEVRKTPFVPKLITSFPYGMVRHPAATGFLWLFWSIPSYTVNHIVYAIFWSIFIICGTTWEENGIRSISGDFGPKYAQYAEQVGMFFPLPRWFLGKPIVLTDEAKPLQSAGGKKYS